MRSDRKGLVRDSDAGDMLELLLVISVATILINRAFLALTIESVKDIDKKIQNIVKKMECRL